MLPLMSMPTQAEYLEVKLEFSTKFSLKTDVCCKDTMTQVNLSCCIVDRAVDEQDVALEVDYDAIERIPK